ncbi:MAG: hypothetical protein R3B82_22260 [Sandaracinaceae bacterium]
MRRHGIALALALLAAAPGGGAAQTPSLAFLDVPPRPRPAPRAPTAEASRGLDELEGELTRFDARGRDYRGTVDALLARRARERRRAVLARYSAAVARERAEEGRTRAEAIARLEEFVRRHPREARHTPSALLRLAELYVDRAYDAPGETLELSSAIVASRRIVDEFPMSAQRERAAYLLGWGLAETGRGRDAVAVWRSVVCANRFPDPHPTPIPDADAEPHPAMSAPDAPRSDHDPYGGCRPSASPLAAEIWLRIGEQHFDAAELTEAIGAYRRVVEHPDDRLFAFGLYKLAWSEYRSSRYADAIEHFAQVVQRSDDELRRTGRAGSDLREEALQYIALTLAHDDWDEDGRADHAAGGPHPLERLEDGSLWPRDRPWSPDVYRRVGEVLFEQAHPDEAIVAWRLRLGGYPAGCDTPEVYLAIVRAARQLGDEEGALSALGELAREVAEDERWRAEACPGQARRAVVLARAALTSTARIRHRRAQRLRARAHVDGDAALAQVARDEYGRAIEAYRRYLAGHPDDEDAYEVAYDLADALYWSERYEEAAQAYTEVRDSPLDGRHFAQAARRVVESLRALAERDGVELPATDAERPTAVPDALAAVARAREIYVRWVTPAQDEERVRDAYAFNNALLVARHGFAREARRRFEALFRERCRGPRSSSVGYEALRALLDEAARREDAARIRALAAEVRERRCSFSPDGPPVLERPDCVTCIHDIEVLERSAELRELGEAARALAEVRDPAVRARRAATIAASLVALVDRRRDDPEAPRALPSRGGSRPGGGPARGRGPRLPAPRRRGRARRRPRARRRGGRRPLRARPRGHAHLRLRPRARELRDHRGLGALRPLDRRLDGAAATRRAGLHRDAHDAPRATRRRGACLDRGGGRPPRRRGPRRPAPRRGGHPERGRGRGGGTAPRRVAPRRRDPARLRAPRARRRGARGRAPPPRRLDTRAGRLPRRPPTRRPRDRDPRRPRARRRPPRRRGRGPHRARTTADRRGVRRRARPPDRRRVRSGPPRPRRLRGGRRARRRDGPRGRAPPPGARVRGARPHRPRDPLRAADGRRAAASTRVGRPARGSA